MSDWAGIRPPRPVGSVHAVTYRRFADENEDRFER